MWRSRAPTHLRQRFAFTKTLQSVYTEAYMQTSSLPTLSQSPRPVLVVQPDTVSALAAQRPLA
jgi:hypothetical protein